MKLSGKLMVLAVSFMLAACGGTNTSSSGGASSGDSSDTSAGGTSSGTSTGGESSSSGSAGSDTTIEPSSSEPYEDQGYSYSKISDYSSILTSEIEAKMDDASLPSEYTTLSDESVSITSAGHYLLGTAVKAIELNLSVAGDVHIYLNGLSSSGEKKAIESASGDLTSTLYLTLLNSSENTISTSKNSIDVLSDVVINGSGTLNITSSEKSAIKSEGTIIVSDVSLVLAAEGYEDGHGVSGETIIAEDASIKVSDAGKDGLHAEIADAGLTSYINSAGYVYLKNVTFSYSGTGDGIQADSYCYVEGGTMDVSTAAHWVAYGSEEATEYEITDGDDFKYAYDSSSQTYYKVESEQRGRSGTYAQANSVKGIKVGEIDQEDTEGNVTEISSQYYEMVLNGGTLTFSTDDDSLHTNLGSLTVNGSTINASTLDQALCADGPLTINDGSDINILSSYEGMQGSSVHINGASTTIDILSTDDGINASSDYSETDTGFYSLQLNINGGTNSIIAGGDGLDSNGSMTFSGGTTYVEASETNEAESPIDSAESTENSLQNGIYVNGGILLATGPSGMVESPRSSSKQNCLVYSGSTLSSGQTLTISDSSGNTLISRTLTHSGAAFIASSPSLVTGSTYVAKLGDTELASATISSIITTIGNGQGGQPGGGTQPGGEPGGGNNPGGNPGGR